MNQQAVQKPVGQIMPRKYAPAAIAQAEIESQIATAKRFPRDIAVFKSKLMAMANIDQETAEGCYYAVPRSGKTIDGPSVRLAEIALSCYGNCIAQADVLDEDDTFIYAQGMCRDLENNVAVRVMVRRRIIDKYNRRYNPDMIAVTANAACAIALRNAIFKVVPGAYIKPVFQKVKDTAVGKAKSLSNRRAEVLLRLGKMGADEARVLNTLGRKSVDDITFDDVAKLIGIGTAVHDGEIALDEAFPPPPKPEEKQSGIDGLKTRLNAKEETGPPTNSEVGTETEAKKQEQLAGLRQAEKDKAAT